MLHVFIINPTSGKKDSSEYIKSYLNQYFDLLNYKVHVTTKPGDAIEYVKQICLEKEEDDEVTFYACGGDGTLNEVVNGAYGFENVYISCYPCGSGNDFVKIFGITHPFKNIGDVINGTPMKIDLIKVNDRLVCNICNLGFDACVGYNMMKYRNWPMVSGKGAYILGVLKTLAFEINYDCDITIDGEPARYNKILLSAIGNGICYGGGFYCLPKAKVNDGLLDIAVVKKVSRFTFLRLVHNYKTGKYLDMKKYEKFVEYKKAKKLTLKCEKGIALCLDGEVEKVNEVNIEIIPNAINFILPSGCTYK